MAAEILEGLLRANLAAAAAILAALLLRRPLAGGFGAGAAYALWAVVPLAALASLLPARQVLVEVPAAAAAARLASGPAAAAPSPAGPVPEVILDPALVLLLLWLAGAAAGLLVLLLRQRSFSRALGPLTAEAGIFRARAAGVGPALIGAVRPRIVVPADFEARFSPEERDVVLAHERTHLRRGDHLVNGLAALLQCLCWFNPLIHLAARRLRVDQELACDAAVVSRHPLSRRSYAEAMLKTQLAPIAPPLGCHWPAGAEHPLKQRIALLAKDLPPASRRAAGLALAAALSLGAGVAAWAAQPPRTEVAPRPVAAQPAPQSPLARRLGPALVEAVGDGDLAGVEALLEAGADPNHHTPGDDTPLIRAARRGDLSIARLLLAHGADPNLAVPSEGSALITAASGGRLDMAELLIAHGARVDGFVLGDETPLINAARRGQLAMVRYLLDQGADPNLAVPSGNRPGEMRSPLGMAGDREVIAHLKSRGARR